MNEQKKFYEKSVEDRLQSLIEAGCSETDLAALSGRKGLSDEMADRMIENVIGTFSLPIGIAQHFVVNGKPVLVPMVIEEPSVVAAASNGARLAAMNGGFRAEADRPLMIGQLQLVEIENLDRAEAAVLEHKEEILRMAAEVDPMLVKLGGGPVDLIVRPIEKSDTGPMLILHLLMDVRDAMGANAVNTSLEKITPLVERVTGGKARLRILSNLADHRLARAFCSISPSSLKFREFSGEVVRDRILEAAAFAEADPYRAVTHNKGIMNGIDAVAIAVGNDWRAIEAGAHSWAAHSGKIRPLSHWKADEDGNLRGSIELPLAVGTVGGATHVHPGAGAALRVMGVSGSQELAMVMASVGLAQNFAALRALSTEGIQRGHMVLHARQVAIAAGAKGDQIEMVAAQMVRDGIIRLDHAKEILGLRV